VAKTLSEQLGMPDGVRHLFPNLTDRWDGKGPLGRARRDEIPLALRIGQVAADAAFQRLLGGVARAVELIQARSGRAFDPDVAACFVDHASALLDLDNGTSAWDDAMALEPLPYRTLAGPAIDRALTGIAGFADLVSPHFAGHSTGVASLAAAAAEIRQFDQRSVRALRRAGLVHDVGRVAIWASVWEKRGPLSAAEWEQVRLHPYHTSRVLSRSPFLPALALTACAHHERLDRSGYHRGAAGAELSQAARVLAAADAFRAMTEARPHRPPMTAADAATELAAGARAGRFDADAVSAVIEAAGQPAPRVGRPAGLTEREAEVLRLLVRGLRTKQVARELTISAKTADHHVQNVYAKLGVSSRAAATLVALEHGIVAWGELPMAGSGACS
jgi:HD-GYP domain-containing protein (c-di-GMP phosphodiesterase class II)